MSVKPKRTLIAYCVLADRLCTPGVGVMQALTPFLAEACQQFAGELFDASKFSTAVESRYGIRIPRLAALGLAEQLAREGLLTALSGHSRSTIYQYANAPVLVEAASSSPVTEAEVTEVLASFVESCKKDVRLQSKEESFLEAALLDRLLNADSMRILSRREASISAKKSVDTLVLKKPSDVVDPADTEELLLDFLVSQFLIDLRDNNMASFERVSNVAFANMAAEAIACFREPPTEGSSLDALTVYLDTPLLLDILGVNVEYAEYGRELLSAIKVSGAKPAALDHCILEAEGAIYAQLAYLRSGVNQLSNSWGTTAKPDVLNALVGNVGERLETRLGVNVQRDPEVNLHRRAPAVVGDIEAELTRRMQAWRNTDAKEHDRKSIWAMLAIRDVSAPCSRICDSKWLLLTRNTSLVGIAKDAWNTWLKGATKHSDIHIERWAPVAMSDKQFAGYLWARTGDSNGSISRARLLAHCSAAVRPRADVKARAYNLVLELHGRDEANDVAALLEDREGARALMRATKGDPEDVTRERLPFILEEVKLAAGEYAAAVARAEGEERLADLRRAHLLEVDQIQSQSLAMASAQSVRDDAARAALLQHQQEQLRLESQNSALRRDLEAQAIFSNDRKIKILRQGLVAGTALYQMFKWGAAVAFGLASGLIALLSTVEPYIAAGLSVVIGFVGFWFLPDLLDRPFAALAMKRLRSVVASKDTSLSIPEAKPNFKSGTWIEISQQPQPMATIQSR